MSRKLVINGLYRHFKGNLYRVETLALHSETLEEFVVYKSIKDNKVWIRPLDLFLSEVDHSKYPTIEQKYRFEYIEGEKG